MTPFDVLFGGGPKPAPKMFQDIVSEVAGKLGVSPIPSALIDESKRGELNAATIDRVNPATGKREFGIVFPPDAFSLFKSRENLSGVIAHELAHVAHDDLERQRAYSRQVEREADDFATVHGFGPQLRESFKLLPADSEEMRIERTAGISPDHDAPKQRIARITRRLKS